MAIRRSNCWFLNLGKLTPNAPNCPKAEAVKRIAEYDLLCEPGTKYLYSGAEEFGFILRGGSLFTTLDHLAVFSPMNLITGKYNGKQILSKPSVPEIRQRQSPERHLRPDGTASASRNNKSEPILVGDVKITPYVMEMLVRGFRNFVSLRTAGHTWNGAGDVVNNRVHKSSEPRAIGD